MASHPHASEPPKSLPTTPLAPPVTLHPLDHNHLKHHPIRRCDDKIPVSHPFPSQGAQPTCRNWPHRPIRRCHGSPQPISTLVASPSPSHLLPSTSPAHTASNHRSHLCTRRGHRGSGRSRKTNCPALRTCRGCSRNPNARWACGSRRQQTQGELERCPLWFQEQVGRWKPTEGWAGSEVLGTSAKTGIRFIVRTGTLLMGWAYSDNVPTHSYTSTHASTSMRSHGSLVEKHQTLVA